MDNPGVFVIAGATSPSGQAIVRRFARDGALLALFSRDAEKLSQLSQTIGLSSKQLVTAALDFRQAEAASQAAAIVQARFGRCDVLINLVGGWLEGKTEEIAETIAFLCSEAAQMINGARIPLYGSP